MIDGSIDQISTIRGKGPGFIIAGVLSQADSCSTARTSGAPAPERRTRTRRQDQAEPAGELRPAGRGFGS